MWRVMIQFQCRKRINRLYVSFSILGEKNDVVHTDGGEESAIMKGILSGMGEIPTWQFKNGVNYLTFTLKKKKLSPAVSLLAAVALALFCGMVSSFLPEKTVNFLSEEMITPVFDTFMGLLSAFASPLIFLSVAGGIYNIGDIATLGKVGKRMISRFLWITLILGNRAAIVSLFLEQANAIILLIMENISAFVPVFIFGSLFNMILGKNFSVLLKAYKVPLVMLLGDVFLMV